MITSVALVIILLGFVPVITACHQWLCLQGSARHLRIAFLHPASRKVHGGKQGKLFWSRGSVYLEQLASAFRHRLLHPAAVQI